MLSPSLAIFGKSAQELPKSLALSNKDLSNKGRGAFQGIHSQLDFSFPLILASVAVEIVIQLE